MSRFSKKILDQIKEKKVMPKSYWYFFVLHSIIWAAIISVILLSSLGIAIFIRHLSLTDWDFAKQISSNPFRFMPFLWLIVVVICIFIADKVFKKTKKGYKFKVVHIVIVSVVLSGALGSGFFVVDADQHFENGLRKKFKIYQQWENNNAAKFVMPNMGILAGEVTHINLDKEWKLIDFNGELWVVDIRKAKIAPNLKQNIGIKVGMRGKIINKVFVADRVRLFKKNDHKKSGNSNR